MKTRFYVDYGKMFKVTEDKIEMIYSRERNEFHSDPVDVTSQYKVVGSTICDSALEHKQHGVMEVLITPNYLECGLPEIWKEEIKESCKDMLTVRRVNQLGNFGNVMKYTESMNLAVEVAECWQEKDKTGNTYVVVDIAGNTVFNTK